MAGILKPNNVNYEIGYKIWNYSLYDPAENLFNGSTSSPHSGVYSGSYYRNNYDIAYWSGVNHYLDIEFYEDVNIWDYGPTPTALDRKGSLSVYKNDNGIKGGYYTELLEHSVANTWKMIGALPRGRYRIEFNSTWRISTEWYLESKLHIEYSNLYLSKTNISLEDTIVNGKMILSITDYSNTSLGGKYKILINDDIHTDITPIALTPYNLQFSIDSDDLSVGDNILKIIVYNESEIYINSIEYNIIKENRDTFSFIRRFDFKEDYITDPNISAIYKEGLTLNEVGYGEVNINIPTEGKACIKNIITTSDNIQKTSIIPILTSNNQNGFEVSASSIYNTDYEPWKVFNNSYIYNDGWATKNAVSPPHWLKVKLPYGMYIDSYSITSRDESLSSGLKSWILQGSNDSISWHDLDTVKNEPAWGLVESRSYSISSPGGYQYYRIYITEGYYSDYVTVGELKLYGGSTDSLEEVILDDNMNFIDILGEGKLYESKLLTNYGDIINLEVVENV